MERLKEILIRNNFPARIKDSIASIEEIEDLIKFDLPEDYKWYLNNFNEHECFIGAEYLRLWDLNSLLENNIGYNIIANLNKTIGIGTNMGGECIALEYINQNNYRVVIFDFIDMSREYHINIGSSFTDMLIRLDERKEWFS